MFGTDGVSMLLKSLIGEKQMAEVLGTFETIKKGVVEVRNALNTIHEHQKVAAELATARHTQILDCFAQLGVRPDVNAAATALLEVHKPN